MTQATSENRDSLERNGWKDESSGNCRKLSVTTDHLGKQVILDTPVETQ